METLIIILAVLSLPALRYLFWAIFTPKTPPKKNVIKVEFYTSSMGQIMSHQNILVAKSILFFINNNRTEANSYLFYGMDELDQATDLSSSLILTGRLMCDDIEINITRQGEKFVITLESAKDVLHIYKFIKVCHKEYDLKNSMLYTLTLIDDKFPPIFNLSHVERPVHSSGPPASLSGMGLVNGLYLDQDAHEALHGALASKSNPIILLHGTEHETREKLVANISLITGRHILFCQANKITPENIIPILFGYRVELYNYGHRYLRGDHKIVLFEFTNGKVGEIISMIETLRIMHKDQLIILSTDSKVDINDVNLVNINVDACSVKTAKAIILGETGSDIGNNFMSPDEFTPRKLAQICKAPLKKSVRALRDIHHERERPPVETPQRRREGVEQTGPSTEIAQGLAPGKVHHIPTPQTGPPEIPRKPQKKMAHSPASLKEIKLRINSERQEMATSLALAEKASEGASEGMDKGVKHKGGLSMKKLFK